MKIAVLGASLEGLFMAHMLAERDHTVALFGPYTSATPDPTSFGVKYTPGVQALMPYPKTLQHVTGGVFIHNQVVAKESRDYTAVAEWELRQKLDLQRFETSIVIPELKRSEWEVIVTTLPPSTFFGKAKAPEVGITWRTKCTDPTWKEDVADDILNMDSTVWWHRVVRYGDGWMIESLNKPNAPNVTYRQDQIHKSKIPMPAYPTNVIPVGRIAEWNDSVNVFDNVNAYIDKVEGRAAVNK